ncbi:MAG: PH domain-containing protein [Candidatus Micrarchaeota archaeon]|nr:PH domain-containing protein [Candidatus Micrarchaeota archaeon]
MGLREWRLTSGIYGVNGGYFDRQDAALVQHLLMPGERVQMTIRQRRFVPGGDPLTPTSLIATGIRLIILYRTSLGLRKYFEIIPYRRITSVRIEHGLISSSIHFHVLGMDKDKPLRTGREEGVVEGLSEGDAVEFANFINHRILNTDSYDRDIEGQAEKLFCRSCGTQESITSKFCRSCGAPMVVPA